MVIISCSKDCYNSKYILKLDKSRLKEKEITAKDFKKCICDNDFSVLIPSRENPINTIKNDSIEEVFISYYPVLKENVSCNGIYLYSIHSKYRKVPLYRNENGRYTKYNYFIILNNKIEVLWNKNDEEKEKFYRKYEGVLIEKFGKDKIVEIRESLIRGYINQE